MTHWRECKTAKEKLRFLEKTVEECCPWAREHNDARTFRTVVVLFAALAEGTNSENLTALTGYPPEFVADISARAGNAGLWVNNGVYYENWFGGDDRVKPGAILLDVMVIEGLLSRQKCEDGKIRYKAAQPC